MKYILPTSSPPLLPDTYSLAIIIQAIYDVLLVLRTSNAVTDLQARTFATWTLTSCLLCLICARNPCVPAIYGKHSTFPAQ